MFIVGVIMIGVMVLGFAAFLLVGAFFALRRKSRVWSIVVLVIAILIALPVAVFAGFILFNVAMEIIETIFKQV